MFKRIRRYLKRIAVGLCLVGLLFVALLFIVPLPTDKMNAPQAYRFYDRNGQLINTIISEDQFLRMHIDASELSPLFINSLLAYEDQYFYQHFGVNPLAIARATLDNISAGRVVSGGSTITMQLARMLQRRDRTLWAKAIEAFRAVQLEVFYDKDEILAHYLAIAPYGGNVEGIQAAAFRYFSKPASRLSIGEIALLVAIPKSPNEYRPDKNPLKARQARDKVLNRMLQAKLIDREQFQRALNEPVKVQVQPLRQLIPHTAWHYRFQQPNRYVWHTTIDENIQLRTQTILAQYIKTLDQYNISNAAAVVIDNRNHEVVAAVGSVDYFATSSLGANDGTRALRSPGSTLKPFLFGLAMQEGLISERTVLYDIPVNYAGYAPQNFSKEFVGPIQAREALTDSLNVVAVNLSNELGIDKLHKLLQSGGITSLDKPASYYGLPLVLGGVEVSLLEITNLYASLANAGQHRAYKILRDQKNTASTQLLSKEASWLVSYILTDVERPDFPSSWQFSANRPTIAWKTGTSYGHQDAWSIGYTPEYTIGVWFGNFDGSTSVGLTGSQMAGPILFDLFQAIQPETTRQWFSKPEGVQQRQVCTTCGTRPTRHCQSLVNEYYLVNANGPAKTKVCDIPQAIIIDKQTGLQATSLTPAKNRIEQTFNIWPAEMAMFLHKHGVPVRNVPPYDLTNMAGQKYYAPKILSPVANTVYYKRLDRLTREQHGIKLSAAVTNRVRKVFWFMNGKLIKQVDPADDVIINPPAGEYRLELIDEVGGRAEVKLVIKDHRELAANN